MAGNGERPRHGRQWGAAEAWETAGDKAKDARTYA